jgi:hypothetical protein
VKRTQQFVLPVEYDDEVTNPAEIAEALDRLMATALSTPGVLDDCGSPRVDEFFPAAATLGPFDIDVAGSDEKLLHVDIAGVGTVQIENDPEAQEVTVSVFPLQVADAPVTRVSVAYYKLIPARDV